MRDYEPTRPARLPAWVTTPSVRDWLSAAEVGQLRDEVPVRMSAARIFQVGLRLWAEAEGRTCYCRGSGEDLVKCAHFTIPALAGGGSRIPTGIRARARDTVVATPALVSLGIGCQPEPSGTAPAIDT